jgi:hypothetical protein
MSRTIKDMRGMNARRGAILRRQRVRRAADRRRTSYTFGRLCRVWHGREETPSTKTEKENAT